MSKGLVGCPCVGEAGSWARPLPQLVGVLPRCGHDSTLPWLRARYETGDGSPMISRSPLRDQPPGRTITEISGSLG